MLQFPDHSLHEFVRHRRQVHAEIKATEAAGIDLSWPVTPAADYA